MNCPRALELGLVGCQVCQLVVRLPKEKTGRCPRCGGILHARFPHSLGRTWALLITAMLLYIPANALPVIRNVYLGESETNTIISGVILFLEEGDWFLALVIFTASILVPLLKMLSLLYLLISVQMGSRRLHRQRTYLYRITELVGRWSMVDVFVIGILTALVQMGTLSSIEPGIGAMAFAGVVICSMLAAMSFDPRLIWDQGHEFK